MSATNRGTVKNENDFYPTPEYTIDSILEEIDFSKVHSFREPCRGNGAIYDKVLITKKDYYELSEGKDYLVGSAAERVDLILTNPPFSLAKEFIEKAIKESDTVCMLQRVNFLGSQIRKAFWHKYPPTHLFVLAQRPKFIAKCTKCKPSNNYSTSTTKCPVCGSKVNPASDATEYAWFVWDKKNVFKRSNGIYVI